MSDAYRDLVFSVSKEMKLEESRDLAYLYHLPDSFRQCKRTMEVLIQLEVEQKVCTPEALAEAMGKIKRYDLESKVRKWCKKGNKKKKGSRGQAAAGSSSDPLAPDEICKIFVEMIKTQVLVFDEQHARPFGISLSPEVESITSALETMLKKVADTSGSSSSSDEDSSPNSTLTRSGTSHMQEEPVYGNIGGRISKCNPPPATFKKPSKARIAAKKQPPIGAIAVLPLVKKPIKEEGTGESTGDSGFGDSKEFLKLKLPLKRPETVEDDMHIYEAVNQMDIPVRTTKGYMTLRREEIIEDEYAKLLTATTVCQQETAHHQLDKIHVTDDVYDQVAFV